MAILTWDDGAEHRYFSGIDKGTFYLRVSGTYPLGVAWNGLISVTETPEGGEPTDLWANNTEYARLLSKETFSGTIEAYTYPDEFIVCDGMVELDPGLYITQQDRAVFGMAFRERIGTEQGGDNIGHMYHLLYGLTVSPSEKSQTTVNDSPDTVTFSWDFTSVPVAVAGYKPTARVLIDGTKLQSVDLDWLEEQLFGTAVADPYLPDVATILSQFTIP